MIHLSEINARLTGFERTFLNVVLRGAQGSELANVLLTMGVDEAASFVKEQIARVQGERDASGPGGAAPPADPPPVDAPPVDAPPVGAMPPVGAAPPADGAPPKPDWPDALPPVVPPATAPPTVPPEGETPPAGEPPVAAAPWPPAPGGAPPDASVSPFGELSQATVEATSPRRRAEGFIVFAYSRNARS
jgi:hypothetical protein